MIQQLTDEMMSEDKRRETSETITAIAQAIESLHDLRQLISTGPDDRLAKKLASVLEDFGMKKPL